jgi:site-specific recombinase XerD
LTDEQLHEAESVFRRVSGHTRPLSFYVEFALANYREPVTQKLLTEAVTEFLLIKDHEREQDLLSEPYLTRVKRDLNRLQKHFPAATVAELTGTRLLGYFEARGAAHKTFNNRRGVVSAFLKFALQRDWIADNPLTKIPPRRIRRRRGCAITFAALQAAALMAHVEENPEIKAKIEERLRNVPEANRERAFINAAKTEAMNQTVRPQGVRVQ